MELENHKSLLRVNQTNNHPAVDDRLGVAKMY